MESALPSPRLVSAPHPPVTPRPVLTDRGWTFAPRLTNNAAVPTRPTHLAQAVSAARGHAHAAKIGEVAAEVAARMVDARARHAAAADIDTAAQKLGLERSDAQTDFGNVLSILERGAEDPAERAIVSAFVAAGVVRMVETDPGAARRWAERCLWLGAHAGFDPLTALPEVEPAVVRPLLRSIAELARQMDQGKVPEADRAELLVATAALADAVDGPAVDQEVAQIVSRLAADLSDPIAARLITARAADAPATVVQTGPSAAALEGVLSPVPRPPWVTVIFALTGVLLLRGLALLVGDKILGLKRTARVEIGASGLEMRAKVALLGKELRDIHAVYPQDGLSSVARDVRYPSLPLYVGLLSLLVGTYAGVSFLSWGVQAASPRLLGYGLLALILGVVLDLALVSLLPGLKGECRLVIVPSKGPKVCVGRLEVQSTDRLLADLSKRLA